MTGCCASRQSEKLLQAHYADAVPLSLMREEQSRLIPEQAEAEHLLESMDRVVLKAAGPPDGPYESAPDTTPVARTSDPLRCGAPLAARSRKPIDRSAK